MLQIDTSTKATPAEQGVADSTLSTAEPAYTITGYVRLVLSTIVITAVIVYGFTCIALEYSVIQIHPAANFVLLFVALIMVAYLEGLHYGVVSIEKWDMAVYAKDYPRVCKLALLVDTPEKVKKFLVGRQFCLLFIIFLIAQITRLSHTTAFSTIQ